MRQLWDAGIYLRDSEVLHRHTHRVLRKHDPDSDFSRVPVQQADAHGRNEFAQQIRPPHRAIQLLSVNRKTIRHDNDPVSFHSHRIRDESEFLDTCENDANNEQAVCTHAPLVLAMQHKHRHKHNARPRYG
jgi:hypothetical protein